MKKKKKKLELKLRQKTIDGNTKSLYRTIRVPLKSFIKNPETNIPIILECSEKSNKAVIRAYQFIRLYVIFKYNKGAVLPKIDQSFCLKVLNVVTETISKGGRPTKDPQKALGNQILIEDLKSFYDLEYSPLAPLTDKDLYGKGYSEVFQKISIEMETSYHNNWSTKFIKRLLTYIKYKIKKLYPQPDWSLEYPNITKQELKVVKAEFFNKRQSYVKQIYDGLWDRSSLGITDSKHLEIYHKCIEDFLPKRDYVKSLAYDLKTHPEDYLLPNLNLNKTFLETEGLRSFQPLSLRNNCVPKYIPFNLKSLLLLFDFRNFPSSKSKTQLFKDSFEHEGLWDYHFKMSKEFMKQKGYSFYNRIDTDGLGCSITFIKSQYRHSTKKPKISDPKPFKKLTEMSLMDLERLSTKKLIGADPGKSNMVSMIDQLGKHLRYTAPQRRKESYGSQNGKIIQKMRKDNGILEIEKDLNTHNSKSMDIEAFKNFIRSKDKVNKQVLEHYKDVIYRKLRLRRFIYRRKSEDRFLNSIESKYGKDVIIGWGNWSRSEQMKGCMSTLGKGLRKIVEKRFGTVSVDEFRTSIACHWCKKDLENVKINKNKRTLKLHRCLVCKGCRSSESETEVPIRFINRDINGSLNILECLIEYIKCQRRPKGLERGNKTKSKS